MTTVDVVIVGADVNAISATTDAVRRGKKVLIVIRSGRPDAARLLRQALRAGGLAASRQVTVLTFSEVVCVDGVHSIEAVVVRHLRTGRLVGINASALLSFEE